MAGFSRASSRPSRRPSKYCTMPASRACSEEHHQRL
jgi:hypothetical protein